MNVDHNIPLIRFPECDKVSMFSGVLYQSDAAIGGSYF